MQGIHLSGIELISYHPPLTALSRSQLLMIAKIAQQFQLSLIPHQSILPEPGITLRPKYDLRMQLQPCQTIVASPA